EQYREAYDLLTQQGALDVRERLFQPDSPVAIPANLPTPLNTEEPISDDYVQVAFDISKYGRSRRVSRLDSSGPGAVDAAKAASRLVSRTRFRPRFEDGEPVRASNQVLRYPH